MPPAAAPGAPSSGRSWSGSLSSCLRARSMAPGWQTSTSLSSSLPSATPPACGRRPGGLHRRRRRRARRPASSPPALRCGPSPCQRSLHGGHTLRRSGSLMPRPPWRPRSSQRLVPADDAVPPAGLFTRAERARASAAGREWTVCTGARPDVDGLCQSCAVCGPFVPPGDTNGPQVEDTGTNLPLRRHHPRAQPVPPRSSSTFMPTGGSCPARHPPGPDGLRVDIDNRRSIGHTPYRRASIYMEVHPCPVCSWP